MAWQVVSLFLMIVLAAVTFCWVAERRYYLEEEFHSGPRIDTEQFKSEAEREHAFRSTVNDALNSTMIYSRLDSLSKDEFARRRKADLCHNVIYLWQNLEHTAEPTIYHLSGVSNREHQFDITYRLASSSLDLLGVSNAGEFEKVVVVSGFTKGFQNEFVDPVSGLDKDLKQFIQDAIVFGRFHQLVSKDKDSLAEIFEFAESYLYLRDRQILKDSYFFLVQVALEKLDEDPSGKRDELLEKVNWK